MSQTPVQVVVSTAQSAYAKGQPIQFKVENNGASSIYVPTQIDTYSEIKPVGAVVLQKKESKFSPVVTYDYARAAASLEDYAFPSPTEIKPGTSATGTWSGKIFETETELDKPTGKSYQPTGTFVIQVSFMSEPKADFAESSKIESRPFEIGSELLPVVIKNAPKEMAIPLIWASSESLQEMNGKEVRLKNFMNVRIEKQGSHYFAIYLNVQTKKKLPELAYSTS